MGQTKTQQQQAASQATECGKEKRMHAARN